MSKRGKLFYNIKDLYDREYGLMGKQGEYMYTPTLQSDYALVIMDKYSELINVNDYEPVLVQSFGNTPFGNDITMSESKIGFQSANLGECSNLSFTYVGTPFVKDNVVYTSIIHYYYAQKLTANGVLKVKRSNITRPTVLIINMRTNNIVYLLKDCTFTYPTFTPSPSANQIAIFTTNVTYTSFKQWLHDNYDSTKTNVINQNYKTYDTNGNTVHIKDLGTL